MSHYIFHGFLSCVFVLNSEPDAVQYKRVRYRYYMYHFLWTPCRSNTMGRDHVFNICLNITRQTIIDFKSCVLSTRRA